MKSALCALVVLLGLFAIVRTQDDISGRKVLVLLENMDIKSTHSIFFTSLAERGYTIDYATANDRGVSLRKYGEWLYDNLVIFAPSFEDTDGITEQDVIDFIDAGRNVLVAADKNIGSFVSGIASECNVEFDEEESYVVDHINFDASNYDGNHDLIVAENIVDAPVVLGGKIEAPVLFRGIAQDIDEDSPVLFSVISGYPSTYSSSNNIVGKKTVLVSALQARNNARVVFAGSLEMFSDKLFNSPVKRAGSTQEFAKSGNEVFCKQIARWTFQERGILRVKSFAHHKVGETSAPAVYRIKDEIEYTIEIEEYKGKKWVPFNANDVQLEFIMLDPYVRLNLKNDGNGKYSVVFKIPDVYGIFTFKVEYNRKGYGYLLSIDRMSVRPFRHNEYERFIPAAFPYYASAFSMMAGLFIFSWFFLYNKQK